MMRSLTRPGNSRRGDSTIAHHRTAGPGSGGRQHHQSRADRGEPGAHCRPGGRGRASVHQGACGGGARDGGGDGHSAPRRARAKPLRWHSGRPEGPVRHRGRAHAGRVARARRRTAGRRQRTGGATNAGCRVRAGGPHQHDRVRVLRPRHQSALRHAVVAVGPCGGANSRRQLVGHRGRGGGRHGDGRRWAPTPAGRVASRRRSAALSATSRPRGGCRSRVCCRCRPAWIRSGRWRPASPAAR